MTEDERAERLSRLAARQGQRQSHKEPVAASVEPAGPALKATKQRAHPAARSRLLVGGVSLTATAGMLGLMTWADAQAERTEASAAPAVALPPPPPPVIRVVYRPVPAAAAPPSGNSGAAGTRPSGSAASPGRSSAGSAPTSAASAQPRQAAAQPAPAAARPTSPSPRPVTTSRGS